MACCLGPVPIGVEWVLLRTEPISTDPLWRFANVVTTPHTGAASRLRAGPNISRFIESLGRHPRIGMTPYGRLPSTPRMGDRALDPSGTRRRHSAVSVHSKVIWYANLSPSLTVSCLKPRRTRRSKNVKKSSTFISRKKGVCRETAVNMASRARARNRVL